MNSKKSLIVVAVLIIVGGGVVYFFAHHKTVQAARVSTNRAVNPSVGENRPLEKLKVATFSGKLERVDTGCFSDAECFVVVDGKHVTTMVGWSQAVVGGVLGVEGIGDLQKYIGKEVEVYAQDRGDGTYTLYGNAGFYVKVK